MLRKLLTILSLIGLLVSASIATMLIMNMNKSRGLIFRSDVQDIPPRVLTPEVERGFRRLVAQPPTQDPGTTDAAIGEFLLDGKRYLLRRGAVSNHTRSAVWSDLGFVDFYDKLCSEEANRIDIDEALLFLAESST